MSYLYAYLLVGWLWWVMLAQKPYTPMSDRPFAKVCALALLILLGIWPVSVVAMWRGRDLRMSPFNPDWWRP